MKIWNIIKEDFDNKPNLDEGWRENVLGTIMGVASLFGTAKGQEMPSSTSNISINQQVSDSGLKLDVGKLFKSGRYRFDKKDDATFKDELRKFGMEIQKNPTSDFTIQIVSSESRVTNYDMEQSSPTYGKPLGVGELAKKRAETVNFIFTNFAEQLKKDGILKGDVKFAEPKILIGDTPWPSTNPETKQRRTNDDSLYTKDQFVIVNVKISKPTAPLPPVNKFAAYAGMGEGIYMNGRLWAMAFEPIRKSNDITKSGNIDAGYQDVLLKTVVPDKKLFGKKDEQGVYLKSYLIPWEWWNEKTGTSHTLTPEIADYIIKHFEVTQ
jgi:hypothetical protein